jgi:cob(I)alamin adenosyltransferase
MAQFYTRRGDDGTTGLLGSQRVPKHADRMEAIGTLDEVSAAIGMARSQVPSGDLKELLKEIQRKLYLLMGEVASTAETAEKFRHIDAAAVLWLEQHIEHYSGLVSMPREFIIPGDTQGGAALAFARTVIRRAERRVSGLIEQKQVTNPEVLKFLNRLSSLFFVLEIFENLVEGNVSQTLVK